VHVEICNRQSAIDLTRRHVETLVRLALEPEGRDAELSVALVGDREMRQLNKRFTGRSATTDVLAFPYGDEGGVLNGEVVVNAELAVRHAASRPHSPQDELALYIVHGVLHLLGYDDHSEEETRRMRAREQAVLRAAGRSVEF